MKFAKSSEKLVRRFTTLLPRHPDAQPKKMFGYPCAFVRGNFWIGLHEENVVVRLPDGLEKKFPALAHAKAFDPMGGRPMRGWFVVPPQVVRDDAALTKLFEGTLEEVVKLPPKGAKPAAKAKKPAAKKT